MKALDVGPKCRFWLNLSNISYQPHKSFHRIAFYFVCYSVFLLLTFGKPLYVCFVMDTVKTLGWWWWWCRLAELPSPIVVGPVSHTVTSSILAGGGDVDVVSPPLSAACSQTSRCSLMSNKAANDEARRTFFTPVTSPSVSSVGDEAKWWKKASGRNSEEMVGVTMSQHFTAPDDRDRLQLFLWYCNHASSSGSFDE